MLGRERATLSAWEANDRVLLATVPVTRWPTPYAQLGDAPILALSATLALWAVSRALAGWRGARKESGAHPTVPTSEAR
jgi:apolipoprotein N-acyltransferase